MYSVDGVRALLGQHPSSDKRAYIYARVSSAKQRGDLERQIQDLTQAYPGYDVIRDVGSGVNFKRKGLQTLLERVVAGLVSEVVVMHRDRLARLGCDLLEFVFAKAGAKLVVHGDHEDADGEHDLADDLLAVTTLFVVSSNGRHAAENRKRRAEKAGHSGAGEATTRREETAKIGGAGGHGGGAQEPAREEGV